MQPKMKWVCNKMPQSEDKNLEVMSLENIKKARAFHKSFPQYSVTPLANLEGMAADLGLGGLFIKDESYRFGLNAFKVLGGSFAKMLRNVTLTTSPQSSSKKILVRQLSLPQLTATMVAALHGRLIAWVKKP